MEKFVIHGGKPLVGEVEISGAKNAAVAILPATILAGGKCVIENLPNISDVSASVDILSAMGAHVRVINKHTLEIDTAHITGHKCAQRAFAPDARLLLFSGRAAGPFRQSHRGHARRL